jgi:uncharacterized protein (TIGR02246 family)
MARRTVLQVARGIPVLAAFALLLTPFAMVRAQVVHRAGGDVRTDSNLAIHQVVAAFSDAWNRHDAAAMCAPLADDVQWTNWSGDLFNGRSEVQQRHATLFADRYKNTHRADEVKFVIYLRPDLASVDDYWSMTGAKATDGSDWPYRKGYINFLMELRGDRWVIIAAHTADFNAKATATPGA